mmetsp:Transcript_93198/g.278218  ORF Transcript_93198/g.278218 Transcript_93198/m.278218 type:complete len:296 (-) Transcript_93198:647-1534(-)
MTNLCLPSASSRKPNRPARPREPKAPRPDCRDLTAVPWVPLRTTSAGSRSLLSARWRSSTTRPCVVPTKVQLPSSESTQRVSVAMLTAFSARPWGPLAPPSPSSAPAGLRTPRVFSSHLSDTTRVVPVFWERPDSSIASSRHVARRRPCRWSTRTLQWSGLSREHATARSCKPSPATSGQPTSLKRSTSLEPGLAPSVAEYIRRPSVTTKFLPAASQDMANGLTFGCGQTGESCRGLAGSFVSLGPDVRESRPSRPRELLFRAALTSAPPKSMPSEFSSWTGGSKSQALVAPRRV